MQYQLDDFFSDLKDPRRGQGQRHKLWDVLTIIIMVILSGYHGLRGFSRFAKSNAQALVQPLLPGLLPARDTTENMQALSPSRAVHHVDASLLCKIITLKTP